MADQPLPPVLFQGLATFCGVLYDVWGTRVTIEPNHEIYGAVLHNNSLYVVTGHPIQGEDGGGGDGGDGGGGDGGDGGDGGGGDGGDGGGGDGDDGHDDPRPHKRSRRENGATATRAETGGP